MIARNTDPYASKYPTPEMLAGVNVLVEAEEDLTVVPCRAPKPPAPGAAETVPTTEDLAGHNILVEGHEDLTVHESSAYDMILEEGCIKGEQRLLLRQGRKRLGQPDEAIITALHAIKDVDRLERLGDAVIDVASWQELLATL